MAEDKHIRLTHDAEQARAVLSEVSVLLGQYHKQLIGAGFSGAQAFALVVSIQTLLMTARTK